MMKFFKGLLKFVGVVVFLAVAAAVVLVILGKQKPEWYPETAQLDPEVRSEAARRAWNKLSTAFDWAAGRQAAEARARTGTPQEPPPADLPPRGGAAPTSTRPAARDVVPPAQRPVLTVSFTEQELNAIFQKWSDEQDWQQAYGEYLADPAVVIRGGRIILAGKIKNPEVVASLHFVPSLTEDGDLRLQLERVMAGRLSMPQGLFQNYRNQLEAAIRANLPAEQRAARLEADGSVNEHTRRAAIGKLLLNVLHDEPAEPVLFIRGNKGRTVPVKLTDAKVEGSSVTLGLEMMAPEERQAFFERTRHPHGSATARGE